MTFFKSEKVNYEKFQNVSISVIYNYSNLQFEQIQKHFKNLILKSKVKENIK
jgi:hypothetical protein